MGCRGKRRWLSKFRVHWYLRPVNNRIQQKIGVRGGVAGIFGRKNGTFQVGAGRTRGSERDGRNNHHIAKNKWGVAKLCTTGRVNPPEHPQNSGKKGLTRLADGARFRDLCSKMNRGRSLAERERRGIKEELLESGTSTLGGGDRNYTSTHRQEEGWIEEGRGR